MRAINGGKAVHFLARAPGGLPRVAVMACLRALLLCVLLGGLLPARAQTAPLDPAAIERVRALAEMAARAAAPPESRVVVEVGSPDPRLRLAPCRVVQPYLPPGLSAWGRSRIGLRCVEGAARWNISLPVRVAVYGRALVARAPLPGGTEITQDQLAVAEIDIAAQPGAVFTDPAQLLGRVLARPLEAGDAVRQPALKARQWFAAGETVQVLVSGDGFAVQSEAQALAPGLEGQEVKVRFENGRVAAGRAVGERRVELLL